MSISKLSSVMYSCSQQTPALLISISNLSNFLENSLTNEPTDLKLVRFNSIKTAFCLLDSLVILSIIL